MAAAAEGLTEPRGIGGSSSRRKRAAAAAVAVTIRTFNKLVVKVVLKAVEVISRGHAVSTDDNRPSAAPRPSEPSATTEKSAPREQRTFSRLNKKRRAVPFAGRWKALLQRLPPSFFSSGRVDGTRGRRLARRRRPEVAIIATAFPAGQWRIVGTANNRRVTAAIIGRIAAVQRRC